MTLTLDEAIRHAEEVADYDCYNDKQRRCADEHRQLAEWLKELKECRQHTGHWVLVNRGIYLYMCDRCGEILQIDRVPIWDYCPVCGARMVGETDGRPNKQTVGIGRS